MKSKVDIFVINKVKERRISLDITQEELSYEIGYSRSYISTIEAGKSRYTIESLYKVSKVLKCNIREFFPDPEEDKLLS